MTKNGFLTLILLIFQSSKVKVSSAPFAMLSMINKTMEKFVLFARLQKLELKF